MKSNQILYVETPEESDYFQKSEQSDKINENEENSAVNVSESNENLGREHEIEMNYSKYEIGECCEASVESSWLPVIITRYLFNVFYQSIYRLNFVVCLFVVVV